MNSPFYKAKFDRLVLNHDSYFIQIDSKGILLTKMCGSGDEKDCDAEMTWDEIYESCHIESPLPSKATVDFLAKMEKEELVETLKQAYADLKSLSTGGPSFHDRTLPQIEQVLAKTGGDL